MDDLQIFLLSGVFLIAFLQLVVTLIEKIKKK